MSQQFGQKEYRAEKKSGQILLSRTQAGPGRTVKQEQEEISRNHVQTFIFPSVLSGPYINYIVTLILLVFQEISFSKVDPLPNRRRKNLMTLLPKIVLSNEL